MEILELARKLGAAIQQDERFERYMSARRDNDGDEELQKMIGEFNLIRMALDKAMSGEEQDDEKIMKCNNDMRELYGRIMLNPTMQAYNSAKSEMDALLQDIDSVLEQCASGADPETVEPLHEHEGCTGHCDSCGGCH